MVIYNQLLYDISNAMPYWLLIGWSPKSCTWEVTCMLITATKQLWQYPSWELHNELTALYIQTLVLTMQQGPYSVYTSIFCLHSPFCNRSGAHWLRTIKELWNCFVLEIIVIVLFTMLYKKRVYSITRTLPPQKKKIGHLTLFSNWFCHDKGSEEHLMLQC